MATAQSISMLSHVLQFIIFKVLANRDYYKLFTVCEWNNLHILKHSLPIQSLAHLLSLGNHEGLLGWQAFSWLHHASWEVRSAAAWACVGSLAFVPWSPLFHAHGSACSDLWSQTLPRRTSLLLPWAGSLEIVDIHNLKSRGSLWSAMVHLFPETSWFCPSYGLTLLPPNFSSAAGQVPLKPGLLNWISFSVFRLNARRIISHILTQCLGDTVLIFPTPDSSQSLKPDLPKSFSCLNFPIRSNERRVELVCHTVTCTHSYLG